MRRWVEFVIAMIASKLILVIILSTGVAVMRGAGQSGTGTTQAGTQLVTGSLILLLGGLAPWIAMRMCVFVGDTMHAAHVTSAQATAGARTAVAAPQKFAVLASQARGLSAMSGAAAARSAAVRSSPAARLPDQAPSIAGPVGSASSQQQPGPYAAQSSSSAPAAGAHSREPSSYAAEPSSPRPEVPAPQGAQGAQRASTPPTERRTRTGAAASAAKGTTMNDTMTGSTGVASSLTRARFGRRSQGGLLLGLSPSRVACVAIAAITVTTAVFLAGPQGLALALPGCVAAIALAYVRHGERPVIEVLPTAGHYLARRLLRQDRYRVSTDHRRPGGTMGLPGEEAALRFLTDPAS